MSTPRTHPSPKRSINMSYACAATARTTFPSSSPIMTSRKSLSMTDSTLPARNVASADAGRNAAKRVRRSLRSRQGSRRTSRRLHCKTRRRGSASGRRSTRPSLGCCRAGRRRSGRYRRQTYCWNWWLSTGRTGRPSTRICARRAIAVTLTLRSSSSTS